MKNIYLGKLAQRNDLTKLAICRNAKDISDLFHTSGNKILGIESVTDDVMYIRYKQKENFVKESDYSNIVLGIYTTSLARIRLYKFMQECLKNGGILGYCDTGNFIKCDLKLFLDSLIMLYDVNNGPPIKTFNKLGSMVVEKEDYIITEFVAAGMFLRLPFINL